MAKKARTLGKNFSGEWADLRSFLIIWRRRICAHVDGLSAADHFARDGCVRTEAAALSAIFIIDIALPAGLSKNPPALEHVYLYKH